MRKERPLCRRAIEKFELRPTDTPCIAVRPDGSRVSLSVGMRAQMRKMREEGDWEGTVTRGAETATRAT